MSVESHIIYAANKIFSNVSTATRGCARWRDTPNEVPRGIHSKQSVFYAKLL